MFPPATAGSQAVTLYEHVAGTAGYVPVQSTTTDANGFYKFTPPALNANTSFYVRSHGAQSGHRQARVAVQVTLTGPPEGTQITTGAPNQQTFSGTVTPADVGARVILQRQNAVTGDEWHRIGIGQVRRRVDRRGVHDHAHVPRARRREHPRARAQRQDQQPERLDSARVRDLPGAEPEPDDRELRGPDLLRASVTISGVLAGVTTPQTVTLLARTVHQQGFAPIAEVSTDASGNYSFPAQAPVNSTLYRVRARPSRSPRCCTRA